MPACKAGRVTHPYSYHYIYIVIFGFPVEIKAHMSGDLNGNKTPEAEVPEGTDGPHQLIGQVLQEGEEEIIALHVLYGARWSSLTRLQQGLSAQDKHLPRETGVKVREFGMGHPKAQEVWRPEARLGTACGDRLRDATGGGGGWEAQFLLEVPGHGAAGGSGRTC